jgi:dTDP-4-amino-4,6-dideoxygalactose transaminase
VIPHFDLARAEEHLRADMAAAAARVIGRGWYVLGEEVERFESEWAAYCGVAHCVGVGNGLDALTLILLAAGIGPGDEVIVPSNAYIAAWLAVTRVGASIVPAEPVLATGNLDPAAAAAAVTPRTAAVIAVDLYGQTADYEPLRALAQQHSLLLIEDAAQAHGAAYRGARAGSLGDAAGWSFYPTKNLGAPGDAGAVTTNDAQLAERVRLFRSYGAREKYVNLVLGVNSRLDELHAAVLRVKLAHLDVANARRRALAARYLDVLADSELQLPVVVEGGEPVWHVFAVLHGRRDALQQALRARGVGTAVFYPTPPQDTQAYHGVGVWPDAPLAREHCRTNLALPLAPYLTDDEADLVIRAVQQALADA